MAVMTIQSDVDTALADFATKLTAVSDAFVAMTTIAFPATPYSTAATQAAAVKAAQTASADIATAIAAAQTRADDIGALVKSLLPVS